MPVSSLLVEFAPDREEDVLSSLKELPGVQTENRGTGIIVVVTDTDTAEEDRALCERIRNLEGVSGANVVFSNMEDIQENMQQENMR